MCANRLGYITSRSSQHSLNDFIVRYCGIRHKSSRCIESCAHIGLAWLSLRPRVHKVLIWHCRHPHGLFSMFSLALGHADSCEKQGLGLVVDWIWPQCVPWRTHGHSTCVARSSSDLLYSGPPGEPNLWNAFFCQPAELKITPEVPRPSGSCGNSFWLQALSQAIRFGQCPASTCVANRTGRNL